jgi:predicted lipoprotein with Yx(FWY)xxD motif/cytochrome c5
MFVDRSIDLTKGVSMKAIARAVILLGLLSISLAQDSGLALDVGKHETHGPHLVNADGLSLYLFLNDDKGEVVAGNRTSSCYGSCAANWPPYLMESWPLDEDAVAGELDTDLLDSVERDDGNRQLTYAGWPLYRFVADRNPGDARGQRAQGSWFLVDPEGDAVGYKPPAEEQEEAAAADPHADLSEEERELLTELVAQGGETYRSMCSSCHGRQGGGGQGPALQANDNLSDTRAVVQQIHGGGHFMPAFGGELSDQELAAVATFIRNSWENAFGLITEAEVDELR